MVNDVPAGFKQAPDMGGYNDTIQPFYYRRENDEFCMGLEVQVHHCNGAGVCHGGALVTFLDNALAMGLSHHLGVMEFRPTINLTTDFVGAAKLGHWIQSTTDFVHTTASLGFITATLTGPDGPVARANGQFKLRRK
ncbi:MAG: acyl-coenzyme A thioesterase 13 [Halioglobus sp.]|jgi:acyl-coenzyme A thioesterase 13